MCFSTQRMRIFWGFFLQPFPFSWNFLLPFYEGIFHCAAAAAASVEHKMGEDAAASSREKGRDKMDPELLRRGISDTSQPGFKALPPSVRISL